MTTSAKTKDRFTSLDTLAVVRELRALGRPRIDKAFDDPSGAGWILALRTPGSGRRDLKIIPGRYAALLPGGGERSEELGPMARELRRLLAGGILASVAEPAGERYLEMEVLRGDSAEPFRLAVELFGVGNLVIAQGSRIVAVAHPKSWAHRTVRIGAEYERPPARPDPWRLGSAEIAEALLASRTDRVSTLAARLGFGGPVAEELLARIRLEGDRPAPEEALSVGESLASAVRELLTEVGDRPGGFLYLENGAPIDVEPFRACRRAGIPGVSEEQVRSFSEAADRYFRDRIPRPEVPDPAGDRRREIGRQLLQQTEAISRLESEVARLRAEAEAILTDLPRVDGLLEAVPAPAEEPEAPIEVELGGLRLRLDRRRTARQSAQALFEEMKDFQGKLKGAREALLQSEAARESAAVRSTAPSPKRPVPRAKRFWFEAYRWFLSSEGAIVVGGRDAASNDRIVKRYLGAGDRYLHADLHGAPSIVVKHPAPGAPPMTEVTLREAAQFGLAFSKAWRAGRASGDAYWVLPEQVSKSGMSGEFVPRGGWMIHGTKHFFRDLPVELGIGEVRYESETLWSVSPPEAIRARGALRGTLSPGEERERAGAEVDLARELGLPRGVLQSLLPAGGFRYLRA
ncbi:MAG: ribosome rescue protein RqcH [Thermoplasmata archaeon]